ncbi:MAG: phenylalanine--tRNA ligase subunit beta [Candidatus Aenigmatarchaeota archaeon]|nr:MAG: phenylalanine--tRNA ligase subunit beta [Candidatus Aenigmarchaeota archaeon]
MPTIEVNYQDLQTLVGEHIPLDVLQEEGILYAKGEIEEIEGEVLKVDIKDTNRPDLWSAEGIARELQGRYGTKKGLPAYAVKPSGLTVKVSPKLKNIRPLTVCAVVKKLNITPDVLSQMIQLQEKISVTFGRNRKEVAIGVYDLHKIKGPIKFTSVKPDGIRFAPLEFNQKMTPAEILKKHPKGLEYGGLLKGLKEYPLFIDSAGEVLSIPPIINSNHTGKISTATGDIFIECSGFNFKFLVPALNTIVAALADRGGQIQSVRVDYPDGVRHTPDLRPKKTKVNVDYVKEVSGLKLSRGQICELLEEARYETRPKGKSIELLYSAYRQDIMHPRDVIEDVIISYGYNRIKPVFPKLVTTGGVSDIEKFSDAVTDVMIGLGFQETLSYMLTNKNALFGRMNLPEGDVVEIENIVSSNWSVFRNWLIPANMEFLAKNKHRTYPQNIFEVGDIITPDRAMETKTRDRRRIAASSSGARTGYEYMASVLDALFSSLGLEYQLVPARHPTFITGRVAEIRYNRKSVGILGEIHPKVLNSWDIENPVVSFEIDLGKIL